MKIERPDVLTGKTHKLKMYGKEEITIYLTINHLEKESAFKTCVLRPHEIFINTKNAEMIEHTVAVTILVSKGLQRGETLTEIGTSLLNIASPFTSHMKKGGMAKSMYSRIAETLIDHDATLSKFNKISLKNKITIENKNEIDKLFLSI